MYWDNILQAPQMLQTRLFYIFYIFSFAVVIRHNILISFVTKQYICKAADFDMMCATDFADVRKQYVCYTSQFLSV